MAQSQILKNQEDKITEAYRLGYNAARDRYNSILKTDLNTQTFKGVMTKSGEKEIIVKQTSLDTNFTVDGVPDERRVKISDTTKIYQFTKSDTQKKLATKLVAKEIQLAEIPVGADVQILANAPVRLSAKITAVEIRYFTE